MTTFAYLFIVATIVFFGMMFASIKSRDENEAQYSVMLLCLLVMTVAGLGLAFNALDLLPELTWR